MRRPANHRRRSVQPQEATLATGSVCILRDTGIGTAPELVPQLFQLYIQVNPTCSGSKSGLAIGLALVRNLVEAHGGRISVQSAGRGCGSEFTIRLPVDDDGHGLNARFPDSSALRHATSGFRALKGSPVDREWALDDSQSAAQAVERGYALLAAE